MNATNLRRTELLLESDLNRQILQLELQQVRHRLSDLRGGLRQSRWKLLAPLAGVLVAWRYRRLGKFLSSGIGLYMLRKAWELLTAWSKSLKS